MPKHKAMGLIFVIFYNQKKKKKQIQQAQKQHQKFAFLKNKIYQNMKFEQNKNLH